MEDSTAKTITFLRARLLAERSVSRTARQRAYELAKRVTELEKQLKFVSLQRKKAEKATVDVLAILENHGRNDLSEPFDSSSDQEEMSSDCKDDKHVATSKHVKVQESDTEGFSGSEVESSSVNGRSLSWRSSKNSSSRLLEKYMDASRRRRNSFASTGSSPRRVGKSCRQIRHREHRSVADGSQNDANNAHREDEGQTSSEGVQNSVDVATETSVEHKICEEKDPPEISTSLCNGHVSQSNGTKRDMERAIEHQSQFIAQYEAEEKAQRDWEDKFRENNGSTPDSCDPGSHSDVTEERDEIKVPPPATASPCSTDKLTSGVQETEAGVVDANFSEETKIDTEPLLDPKNSDMKNKASDDQNHPPNLHGTPRNITPAQTSSSQDCSLLCREQASGQSYETTLRTQKNPDQLGSVLEALQQAKLSLKQNLNKFPLLESGPSVPTHRSGVKFPLSESGPSSVPTYRSGDKFPVPFSPAGLFRLPSDYEYGGTTTRANSLTYDSRLSLTNYPTDPSGGQLISSPYRESLSRSAEDDQFISSPYREPLARSAASLDDRFRMVPTFPYQETRLEPPSAFNPRSDMPPSALDPRLSLRPSATDPRMDLGISSRSDVASSALHPRFVVQPSAFDPRLSLQSSATDPRLDVGINPRSGLPPSILDPRLSFRPSATDPRLDAGVGLSAYDPRLEIGTPFTGDSYPMTAGMPSSSRYRRIPRSLTGGDVPLRTRLLYDDYSSPNM